MSKKTMEGIKMGKFKECLLRNGDQIRETRAQSIIEGAELSYRRTLEDMRGKLKEMERKRIDMLDMSPDNVDSLVIAKDFNAQNFVQKDLDLTLSIVNLQLVLKEAEARYELLFGGENG